MSTPHTNRGVIYQGPGVVEVKSIPYPKTRINFLIKGIEDHVHTVLLLNVLLPIFVVLIK